MHRLRRICAFNFQTCDDGCIDVCTCCTRQRRICIEVVVGVFGMDFNAVVVLVKRNDFAVSVTASCVSRFSNSIVNMGEIDKFTFEHGIWYGHPTFSIRGVRVESEESIDLLARLRQFFYALDF